MDAIVELTRRFENPAEFDIARDGTLAYASGGVEAAAARRLMWVDRQGHEEAIKAAPVSRL